MRIERISATIGKAFIKEHHYSRGCHNGPMTWGLYSDRLVGVVAFATPCSENVRRSVFGDEYKHSVTELHRLVLLDECPPNTESWFISRALTLLKAERPYIDAVISFADSTQGHVGTIYQATNFLYCGTTGRSRFYIDEDNRLRHPRQNGVNITPEMAHERNWQSTYREAKHRYVLLLPNDKRHKRELQKRFRLPTFPYPKRALTIS